jgi:predicted nucleotide-binding protein (sugar kinase/HSP70/actin superfamily)
LLPIENRVAHTHNPIFLKSAKKTLDAIFLPMMDVLSSPLVKLTGTNACPTVTSTPTTVKAAFTKETDVFAKHGIEYLCPIIYFANRALFAQQMFQCFAPLLGLSEEENERAVQIGFEQLEEYETGIRRRARQVLN